LKERQDRVIDAVLIATLILVSVGLYFGIRPITLSGLGTLGLLFLVRIFGLRGREDAKQQRPGAPGMLRDRRTRRLRRWWSEVGQELQVMVFQVLMWGLAMASLVGLVWKAFSDRLTSVSAQFLFILTAASSVLAFLAPSLGAFVVSNLRKLTFGGIELELGIGEEVAEKILDEISADDAISGRYRYTAIPHAPRKLDEASLYLYEKASHDLYGLFYRIPDPSQLNWSRRQKLRKLVLFVGAAALAMEHYTKAHSVLKWLERLPDRDLERLDLKLLGVGYLFATWVMDKTNRDWWEYQHIAVKHLHSVLELDGDGKDAEVIFNIGWACLGLGLHDDAIAKMKEAMQIDPTEYEPHANWNIACAYLGKQEPKHALDALKAIKPNGPWDQIEKDSEFDRKDLGDFVEQFTALCRSKKEEAESGR
jgi:tetratricopeptide (TPR) repeat protein